MDLLNGFNSESAAPYIWLLASSVFAYLISVARGVFADTGFAARFVFGPIVYGLASVLGWVILVALINYAAIGVLDGNGRFSQLLYLSSAATSFLSVVTSMLWIGMGYVSPSTLLTMIPFAYQIVLIAIATMVVHELSWWKATVVVVPFLEVFRACDVWFARA